jgi:hypothetical protein
MRATKGDPSNRKVLITPDPAGGESAQLGIIADRAGSAGQVIIVDDLEFLVRPGDVSRVNGATIEYHPVESGTPERWMLSRKEVSVAAAVRQGVVAGSSEQFAKFILGLLFLANLGVLFGIASLMGLYGDRLKRFGPMLAVTAAGLAVPETLLFPRSVPGGLAFARRFARAWWYYLAWAVLVGFAYFVGTI